MVALKVEGPELLQRRKRALLKPSELVVGEVKPREGREVRKGVVSDGAGDLVPAQREGPQARHARKGALRNRLDSTVGQVEVGAGCRALACAREPVPVFFEPEGAAAAHLKLHPRRRRVRTRVHRCVCLYNTQTVRRVHPRRALSREAFCVPHAVVARRIRPKAVYASIMGHRAACARDIGAPAVPTVRVGLAGVGVGCDHLR